jgi:acyl-coenzyme A synthetase/AMP-(fatty) acid ligase
VVLRSDLGLSDPPGRVEALKSEILKACHRSLAAHKVPAAIRLVPSVEVTASGKLARLVEPVGRGRDEYTPT